ncbi:MAG TPA: GFA family protein [Caulobacteraceae bacterium]|jgi:hypothetical protein
MTSRVASCSCGQLRVTCEGEPVRAAICHCLACQKRTGSVFAVTARFPREAVTSEGRAAEWSRQGDSGHVATFHFCPTCGSTVWWNLGPDFIAVTVGAFADPSFPPPVLSVYDDRQHPWAMAAGELPMEHYA